MLRSKNPTPDQYTPQHLSRMALLALFVLVAAGLRLIPHPPNFAPIGAMALFGGAHFSDRRVAILLPLAALFMSDLVIGFYATLPLVYASFLVNVLLGRYLRSLRGAMPTWLATGLVTLAGSLQFFILTNFGCWLRGDLHTLQGFVSCHVKAIPFFENTLLGDFVFVTALFGGFALCEKISPALREQPNLKVTA